MKNSFAKWFDFIFTIFIIFLISLIWFRSYVHNTSMVLIYASIVSILGGITLSIFFLKKTNKQTQSKKEQLQMDLMEQTLTFNTQKENLTLLKSIFHTHYEIKQYKNYILLTKNNNSFGLTTSFDSAIINETDVLKIYKEYKEKKLKKLFVCCNNFDKKAFDLTKKFIDLELILLNKHNVYFGIFKKYGYEFEKKSIKKSQRKEKFKSYLFIAFNRKKTKAYFFAGIILLLGTIFMRYNIYYLIWTSVMFCFALFSFFNQPFNPKIQTEIFEQTKNSHM